jgi:hypothetical protein
MDPGRLRSRPFSLLQDWAATGDFRHHGHQSNRPGFLYVLNNSAFAVVTGETNPRVLVFQH